MCPPPHPFPFGERLAIGSTSYVGGTVLYGAPHGHRYETGLSVPSKATGTGAEAMLHFRYGGGKVLYNRNEQIRFPHTYRFGG